PFFFLFLLLQWLVFLLKSIGHIYTDPLNFLQAELLKRNREMEEPDAERAIMVTIAGIAAGMRNTG
ncbi:MAG: phosphoenolpyruvate carboxylase, partial [Halioglobus sp.]|nr:phosphoenolpyruvate carboxylase [Halioglobus sp.]